MPPGTVRRPRPARRRRPGRARSRRRERDPIRPDCGTPGGTKGADRLLEGDDAPRGVDVTMENRTTAGRRYYGGLYADRDAAERGIRRFHEAGYDRNRIGIIAR